jgi:hypothetical protein
MPGRMLASLVHCQEVQLARVRLCRDGQHACMHGGSLQAASFPHA